MANISGREKVHILREKGMSIRDISLKTKIAKSTVSYWCRDIALTRFQIEQLNKQQKVKGLKSLLIFSEKKRKQRILKIKNLTDNGAADVREFTKRDLFILGLALYWGEGYKKGNDEFGFTNSDPVIIKSILIWLKIIYNISFEDVILRVSINHFHKNREKQVLRYWANITNIGLSQFTKTSFIKTQSKKIYVNHHEHYGTLRLKIRRGADLRRRILGSIAKIGEILTLDKYK